MESTTDCLTLKKCYPKHKGFYYCVVTDESGKLESSDKAALTVGELINFTLCIFAFFFFYMSACIMTFYGQKLINVI